MFKLKKEEKEIEIKKGNKVFKFKEGDRIKRKFLKGTQDKYDCIVVFMEVEVMDTKTMEKTGEKELKAFAQRVGEPNWIMPLDESTIDEYIID